MADRGRYGSLVGTISAAAVRASDRPAAGHLVLAFALAADRASDLVGRPGFAGRLGLDYSYVVAFLGVIEIYVHVNRRLTTRVPFGADYIWGSDV